MTHPKARLGVALLALGWTCSGCREREVGPQIATAVEICVDGWNACARLHDGAVACWGEMEYWSGSPFVLDVGATKMRCGRHVCVELADGSIDCYDWEGQLEEDAYHSPNPETLPFSDWWLNRSRSGGCGIDTDARAICWGEYRPEFEEIASSYGARHVGFTDTCWMLTDTDGRIHSIFDRGEDCVQRNAAHPQETYGLEAPPEGDDWQRVEGGEDHACALDSQGQATCWGRSATAIEPPADLRFTELSSSYMTSCGVTTEGMIGCWSLYDDMPEDVPTTSGWAHVSLSFGRACAIDVVGQVHCFGAWNPAWTTYEDALALR